MHYQCLSFSDTPGNVSNASCERNYSSNVLTTSWTSLPSLDLTDTDPDIVYIVDLFRITCGEDVSMSHENVTGNSTSNTVDLMQIYKAIITPRNNVDGARNGTSVILKGTSP